MARNGMMMKWTTKSQDHNASRIRNNQRRHRARIKSHIAELEATLAETKLKLNAAQDRIRELTTEVERSQARVRNERMDLSSMQKTATEAHPQDSKAASSCDSGSKFKLTSGSIYLQRTSSLTEQRLDLTVLHSPRTTVQPQYIDPSWLSIESSEISSDSLTSGHDCGDFPSAEQDESIMECKSAYEIIMQQNFKQLDFLSIQRWLKPGFRRAGRPGQGCCVNTALLYTFIDFISQL
ncbi:hypothetical protein M433DRAFT_154747 [Acidomyces richmondensis BFW]|nr:MAG: hypothetical protein FE78DRAFT_91021 [Acidomyces sp. 'richmondensis']KYG45220.1 hypothetical protein M433DRAFT_154747 [Acidomyces richmondensis BFW]